MGGWATTKTQGTKITPAVLQEAIGVLENIFYDFNQWAQAHGFDSLTVVGPGGSGVYFKKDLAENPDKAYGDVDILVMYPLTEPQGRQAEIDTLKKYNGLFLQWLAKTTRPDLDTEETEAISEGNLKLVINLTDGPVQVDVIPTFTYSADWAKARYTPIRGIKGFVVGFLYQSFGNALGVSVTDRGVVAKIKGGDLVNPLLRKGVEERIVTRDFNRFLAQLAEFTDEFTRGEKRAVQLDQYLQQHPGIDVTDLSLEQICNGILGFARTLEQNGTFELPLLPDLHMLRQNLNLTLWLFHTVQFEAQLFPFVYPFYMLLLLFHNLLYKELHLEDIVRIHSLPAYLIVVLMLL